MPRLRPSVSVVSGFAALAVARPAVAAGEGLEIFPDPELLAVLLVLFVLLIPVLDRVMFRPILRVLDAREERIRGARDRAAQLAREAETLLDRHRTAVRETRGQAEAARRAQLDRAREEHARLVGEARRLAEGEIQRATESVAGAVEAARARLRSEAQVVAREVAARLLGRELG